MTIELPPGVERVNQRTERDPPPSKQCVVFVIARTPDKPSEGRASVWDLSLASGGTSWRLTERLRLGSGAWQPEPLAFRGVAPVQTELVRLGKRLFRIDYRTWDVHLLSEDGANHERFSYGDSVYVSNWAGDSDLNVRVVRLKTNTVENPKVPFQYVRPLLSSSTLHLVHKDGAAPDRYDVFDAGTERFVASCVLPGEVKRGYYSEVAVSDDLKWFAVHVRSDIQLPEGTHDRLAESRIRVINAVTGETRSVPIGVYLTPVKGRVSALEVPRLEFSTAGLLRYSSVDLQKDVDTPDLCRGDRYEYDPATGISNKARQVSDDDRAGVWKDPAPLQIPSDLRPLIASKPPQERDLAHAFLKFHGIKYTVPAAALGTAATFTADKHRFVLGMSVGERDDAFFIGDLETSTLCEVPRPPELRGNVDFSFYWVAP